MLIPIRCDAPLYHYPIATVTLIVVNVFAFPIGAADMFEVCPYWLEFGNGLQPFQWLTHMFLHADVAHLIGNMVFLWIFGLIVEGKVGWWRFAAIYIAVGVATGAVMQVAMLAAPIGYAVGASGAIFGLLAICWLWAPRNEIAFIWIIYYRAVEFEASLLLVGLLFIGLNYVELVFNGFAMSGAAGHLIGAIIGGSVGLGMLVTKLVDCEEYDVLSIIRGTEGETDRKALEQLQEKEADQRRAKRRILQEGQAQILVFLDNNNWDAAARMYQKLRQLDGDFLLGHDELVSLTRGLLRIGMEQQALGLLREYTQRFPSGLPGMLLSTAKLELMKNNDVRAAVEILDRLDPTTLNERQREYLDLLYQSAAERVH